MLVSVALWCCICSGSSGGKAGYSTSLDIMHDRFGYYICWGVVAAYRRSVYTLTAQYPVLRPSDLAWPLAAAIFVLGAGAICINYAADAQRQRVRATDGASSVWGRPPELIRASYVTADGRQHENLLLTSGWWGLTPISTTCLRSRWRWPGACRPGSVTSYPYFFTWST